MNLPMWLAFTVFVLSAVDTYLLTQTTVTFSPTVALILGAVNIALVAMTAFQRTAVNTVRRLRGKPTV